MVYRAPLYITPTNLTDLTVFIETDLGGGEFRMLTLDDFRLDNNKLLASIPYASEANCKIYSSGYTPQTVNFSNSDTVIDKDVTLTSVSDYSKTSDGTNIYYVKDDYERQLVNDLLDIIMTKADSSDIPTQTSDLTNDSGFITGIASSDVITALTYTPYNGATNPNGYITNSALTGYATETWVGQQGYITGITPSDVTTALGYTPYDSSNPNGYTSNTGTVTSVNNVSPVSGNVTLSIPSKISDLTDDTATYPVDKADTLTGLTASITELNYTDGVTSNIQTQLNGKATSTLSNVTAQSVANAIGYTPANLNLSNLTTTGKLVINGAVTSYNTEIFNGVSLNGSTDLEYTLSGLPNDNYTYMVLFSGAVSTGSSSGNYVRIGLYSDACPAYISLCSARTRSSSNQNGSGNCWMPVPPNRKIYVARSTSWNGTATLETKLYYRIGNGITI